MKPSRTRHWVVVFALTVAVICYTDRVIIAQAASLIRSDFGLTEVQMGWVFAVFSWAYTLFEVPGGWMGDRWGARRVLLRVVTWWSAFTAATGWMWNYVSLLLCRFLFGAGEAGCFPNLAKAFTTWLPGDERVRAQGWMWCCARWGGAVTPFLVAALLQVIHWRYVFLLFGGLGVVWAVLFAWWYRDHPRDHPGVNAAELALLPATPARLEQSEVVPWRRILTHRSIWLLWLQYLLISYGWWFYITWLPTYLREARGFVLQRDTLVAAMLAGLPLFLGGIGCWLSGQFLTPWLIRRVGSRALVRRGLGFGGLAAAGALLVISLNLQDPVWAMIAMGLAGFANDLTMPGSWGACMDMGGRCVGSVSGGMNMCGAAGGALAGMTVGYLLRWTGNNWNVPIGVAAALYFLAALCWLKLDPVTPVAEEQKGAPSGGPGPAGTRGRAAQTATPTSSCQPRD
jgi:MFS family permease